MERCQKPEAENARGPTVDYFSVDKSSSLDYNTPLRSVRGDATSAPSPFYKLSAELSRESLRIPGAVPFMWEQSPGCRKFTGAASLPCPPVVTPFRTAIPKPQAAGLFDVPDSGASTLAVDPAKPSLATLFRQTSLKGVVAADMPSRAADSSPDVPNSLAIPQILPPPAADNPRTSSARYSVYRNAIPGTSFYNAASQIDNDDDDDDVSDDATSDAVTATAGGEGLSIDDSLVQSGDLRPASTPSGARDFIMHRFLPAAHTIACESPQTPSRRFVQTVGVGAMTGSPSTAAGSFRDYAGAACRPSPLRYASASSTPANPNARQMYLPRGQLQAGSFHGEAEQEEEEEEEEEEEPPFTPRSCGIFPFRITISFQNRRTTGVHESSRRNLSASKHQHSKQQQQQQQQKKGCKSINCAGSTTRIMDILRDDQSSSHDGESPVHRLRGRSHSEAERERIKIAVLEKAGLMHPPNDCRPKPPSVSYYRESSNLHQLLTAQHAGSVELYNEEGSDYSSYQDAPSRFQSPSQAAFHLNARALRTQNAHAPQLVAQRTRAFVPGAHQDDHKSAAIISTTEKHLLNSSFYYYNKQSDYKPHVYQPQLNVASPSTYHTPLSSHVGGAPPHQNYAYHDNLSNKNDSSISSREKANYQDIKEELWDTASPHSSQKAHIINNALFEHEEQEDNMIANTKWTALNHHRINGDLHIGGTGDHHVIDNGKQNVSSKSHYVASKDDLHYVVNGDHHVINGHNHVTNGHNHLINANNHLLSNGDMYVSANGDVHAINANSSLPSKSLLMTPPLPKSPTHSWLDRTMPLVASHSNTNRFGGTASSRLSHMHKASIPPADDYGAAPVLTSKMRKQGSSEASKWEALVKGSNLQPGHLRFSEELFHQSQNFMKVGASY